MRGLLLAVLAMCVACDKPTGAKEDDIGDIVVVIADNHYLGDAVQSGNLTVWPIFALAESDIGEFLTLAEAKERGVAEVREKDAAEVATLVIENKGDLPILVCAGSMVTGGKQDRQIGQDFVVEAKTTVPVTTFCVEAHRWTGGDKFDAPERIATAKVRMAAQYDNDQGKVWKKVAEDRADGAEVEIQMSEPLRYARGRRDVGLSPIPQEGTSACEVELDPVAYRKFVRKIRKHFDGQEQKPVGFAYAIGGKAVSVRTFAHPRLFAGQFDAFLSAMCLESVLSPLKKGGGDPNDFVELVRDIAAEKEQMVETAAANTNGYRRGKAGFNGSCYMRGKSGLVAITQDWTRR